MMSVRLTLDQCGRQRRLQSLPVGTYQVEYTDSSHLNPADWVQLASVEIQASSIPVEDSYTEQFFTFAKSICNLPGKPTSVVKVKDGNERPDPLVEHNRRMRVLEDALSLALGRVGLLAPEVPAELLEQLLYLDKQDGVVIVPDTNALHNGAVHWLFRVLRRPSVWLMPVVASLTTIQTRDATVKGLVNKMRINNLSQALRSRGLVNGALGLLERNKGRCQVVEIDPSLLRYQKVASSSSADPDQSDVLEDRLIIEAIHGVLRSMRSRTARRVVTSDVNIARVLAAEGIETLFVPSIMIGDAPIECLRYDALARSFVGAPLRATLWELAHVFGTIRLKRGAEEHAKLDCYWPGKTPAEWGSETLLCHFEQNVAAMQDNVPSRENTNVTLEARTVDDDGATSAGDTDTARAGAQSARTQKLNPKAGASNPNSSQNDSPNDAERSTVISAPGETATDSKDLTTSVVPKIAAMQALARTRTPITTSIPRATLPRMLRLLGIVRQRAGATAEQIVSELQEPISADKARRPLEILRRMRLVEQVDNRYWASKEIDVVDTALRGGDLDSLSDILERFEPYRAFRQALKKNAKVRRGDAAIFVQSLIGPAGSAESDRLPRYHILLGQAWTDGEWIVDGSNRLTDRDASDVFEEAFRLAASVGIAKMQDLLLNFSRLSAMSPWAVKRQIEHLVAARMLAQFSFEPAAGARPITSDEVIAGSLDFVSTESVIIDRIFLGERPVFTVERSSI